MFARMLAVSLLLVLVGCQYNKVTMTGKVTALTPTPVTFEGAVTLERPATEPTQPVTRLVSLGRPVAETSN